MKKFAKIQIFFSLLAASFGAYAQVTDGAFSTGVPEAFDGVWERDDRYVIFSCKDGKEEPQQKEAAAILLKTFYSWYLDRTAEPEDWTEKRTLNDSTCPEAERIFIEYRPLVTSKGPAKDASVWEIFLWHPRLREASVIPVAIIGGNLYLNFAVKLNTQGDETDENKKAQGQKEADPLEGFWARMSQADGVKVCPPVTSTDIYSTYITKDAVYTIRYWRTDMEYTNEMAFFSDGGQTFSVVKHIQSAGKIYTCANGRSVTIRNVQKTNDRPQVYELDGAAQICGLGEPYLKRVQDSASQEAVVALAKKYFAQRAPNPDPPFPPSNLDWHMDDINRLEAGNQIIQAVRKRQREFAEKYPARKAF
ncbi:MAG: hypothetical protein IK094_06650 [Treponema sp.]|nr:hypothetical protein [Treponema sp.]